MARAWSSTSTDRLVNTDAIIESGSGTISIWLNPGFNSGDSTVRPIWMYGILNFESPSFQRYSDNNIYVGFNGNSLGDQRITIADTDLFTSGSWANWVFTWATTGCFLYKDATQKGTHGATTLFTKQNLTVGNYDPSLSNASCLSTLMDFAYWNVVLTAGEISALASGIRANRVRLDNLKMYYPIDGLTSPEPNYADSGRPGAMTGTSFAPGAPVMMMTRLQPMHDWKITDIAQRHFRFRTDANAVDATPTWGASEDAA